MQCIHLVPSCAIMLEKLSHFVIKGMIIPQRQKKKIKIVSKLFLVYKSQFCWWKFPARVTLCVKFALELYSMGQVIIS